MDKMTWVTTWEAWRAAMGTPSSRQRKQVDKFLETHPSILYWGDSWFSTMLYLNLARQSIRRIDGMGILIGKPGATAERLFAPSEVKEKSGRLKRWPFDLVCLSAGGNDALAERLEAVFKDWVEGTRNDKLSAEQAYEILLESNVLPTIRQAYVRVLEAIKRVREDKPNLRVLAHSYARITRVGAKADLTLGNIGLIALLKGDAGPWLWRVMRHVLRDEQAGREFADKLLIDGFLESVMQPLAAPEQYGSFFSVVDFSDVEQAQAATFWNDEIHPTEEGFAVLAERLNASIKSLLPAHKRDAVL
jgi:lysophospholipase L1-like esterase